MKGIVKKQKLKQVKQQQSDDEISQISQQKIQQQHFNIKKISQDKLFVTFNGIIQSGVLQNCQSLTLIYSITSGSDWIQVAGQKTGVSQVAASNGKKMVWNLPFEISFQTTYLAGWPQLIVMIYGTDFLGRSFVEGYGNVHLPTSSGVHNKKLRLFKPLPQSILSGIFGFLGGVVAQYKDPEKVLSSGEGRQVTRVSTNGQISIRVQTSKHNFKNFGYQ